MLFAVLVLGTTVAIGVGERVGRLEVVPMVMSVHENQSLLLLEICRGLCISFHFQ